MTRCSSVGTVLPIDALARAGRLLGEPRYTTAADRAADFLWTRLRSDGRLLHNWRAGRAGHPAYLDDYAGLANSRWQRCMKRPAPPRDSIRPPLWRMTFSRDSPTRSTADSSTRRSTASR